MSKKKMYLTIFMGVLTLIIPFALLAQDSSEWRLPTKADLGDNFEWRKENLELYLIAIADFNDDGKEDVVRLLVNDKENQLGLFVTLTSQKDASPMLLETIKKKKSILGLGVKVAKPGRYKTACGKGYWPCGKDEPAVIEIKHSAIDLFQSEGANSYFIWNDKTKKMKRIWMSD
jgi:hypothetical protein